MKVYVAAAFERRRDAEEAAGIIRRAGHLVVSSWHKVDTGKKYDPEDVSVMSVIAERDLDELAMAGVIVVLTDGVESHGGKHVETGVAIGDGKRVIVVGPRENVFHSLSEIIVVDSIEEAVAAIAR